MRNKIKQEIIKIETAPIVIDGKVLKGKQRMSDFIVENLEGITDLGMELYEKNPNATVYQLAYNSLKLAYGN
ncbi:hypothetical protein J32TS6_19330 [Virgibacillus pantothenticus]|uniref:Uncharacterized protein n=1 Tax=Virgibacillus pantothenticus TaxID=1473 RepID=A0A0L0QLB3_VIRPA|nr:hypothetical protein [Virgibacillus pantothenticus]KNE19028.1 hypothetical protein AFK71_10705 [Virgibacillus pantothenticus]MED3738696.1 hypothetical protein [Virgibacillus pantothenticus]QTY15466.1 hypothetical protein KBP50_16470 [Virgibacillus pantothenticus]SIT17811.1 hypothetical protein SAMN05421787_1354 [Virgibacillus pantothenticus]GIP63378.1 hypothetical protein J32TS6_19330 [Virgibacillus pantothenticus]